MVIIVTDVLCVLKPTDNFIIDYTNFSAFFSDIL